jgi:hypothetical protein
VDVFPDLEQRLPLGFLQGQRDDRVRGLLLELLRRQVEPRIGIAERQRQQRGEQRHGFLAQQPIGRQRAFELGEPGRAVVLRLPPGEALEVLNGRIERAVGVVGRAPQGDARQTLGAHRAAHRVDQRRFADPRLAADKDDLAVALFLGLLPGAAQQADLLVAADQRQIGRHGFEFRVFVVRLQTGDAPDLDRFGDAFERVRAETLAGEDVADETLRGGADQNGVGAGEGLQAGGEVGGVADDRLLARGAFADRLADHDQPARDADAHGEAGSAAAGDSGVERRQRVEDRESGAHRALGILFLRVRVAEINQHAIAHELGDVAVEAPNRLADRLLIGADHIAHVFGIDLRRETRRIRQVAEHHGQVPALGAWQIAVRGKGGRPLGEPQGRQRPRQRGVGARRLPLGRPNETLAVDIRRQPLDADQLAAELFERLVIETEAQLDAAIGNAALGDEAPDDFFQDLIKVHASAPVRRELIAP